MYLLAMLAKAWAGGVRSVIGHWCLSLQPKPDVTVGDGKTLGSGEVVSLVWASHWYR